MKLICSGGKGIVTREECLSCAANGEQTCGMDYGLIRALLEKQVRDGVHVTDLLGCLRKTYFEKTSPVPLYVHEKLVLALGTAVHGFLEGDDDVIETEVPVEGLGVVGTADVVYRSGRIVDYKTTRWITPSKLPYGSHVKQVNLYAHMLRLDGFEVNSLAIQYIDMSGPTKCRKCKRVVVPMDGYFVCPSCNAEFPNGHIGAVLVEVPILPEREIDYLIKERGGELSAALDNNHVPSAEPGWLCSYCPFTARCPEGAATL